MEILCGSAFSSVRTRKRSRVSRRPRDNPDAMFQSYFSLPSFTGHYGKHDENEIHRDIVVASDGSGAENKLKKLKLKFGGVTHTIHTKFASTVSGIAAENHPCQGKTFGESLTVNHELVHKWKCIPKRRALDVEFIDEENEDAEPQFPASKVDINCSEDNWGTRTEHMTRKVAERGQMDGLNDSGTPGSSKDGKKKLKLEREYRDHGYAEEGGPTSNGKSISEMKKTKKESSEAKDVLSGSDASIIDISDGFIPTVSQRKKGKLSEMEQELKKAEAAQRRKMQSEKAAREAQAEAIRKILGQDSGRKKKEEKMKKQRSEFSQEKSSNSFNLGSNTVRWTMGPSGTVVTFSDDIGLPSIFQMVPKSYPPPREKCAGPNCTNVYKYRDSKSKLPLCSLDCYRAIHEKMQRLIAC